MNDLENKLASLPLTAPSAELDRRLDAAFATAAASFPARTVSFRWSLAALAVAGAAAALALLLRSPSLPTPQIVYRIEARGPLRELLLEPPSARTPPPRLVVRVRPS